MSVWQPTAVVLLELGKVVLRDTADFLGFLDRQAQLFPPLAMVAAQIVKGLYVYVSAVPVPIWVYCGDLIARFQLGALLTPLRGASAGYGFF
ncbi:MAG: hypothetical protein R8G60_15275 [Roseovarius pacificus]|nr:hypothetical protein [Roseovarius pacificus]